MIITVFHLFRKLSRDIEDRKKGLNQTSGDEDYDV